MTNQGWESLSDQAITVCGVVYFLALVAHSAQWAWLRRLPADETPETGQVATVGRFGVLLTMIAAGVHLVGLVGRGMAAEPNRVPWGNMYEFTLTGTFTVVALYLLLYRRYSLSWLSPWVVGFVWVILMVAMIWLYEQVAPLTEALSSPWLVIHVVAAVLATGIFSLGGIVSILYLVKSRVEEKERARARAGSVDLAEPTPTLARPEGAVGAGESGGIAGAAVRPGGGTTEPEVATGGSEPARKGILARVPGTRDLDRLAYRLHAFAFPVWTFAVLIAGPIWAHYAWSRYWSWDPKEVWAFITWVVYAAYLHARATAGWKGRNAAILALVGLATLWFNFVGINYFFGGNSQHSYAEGSAVVRAEATAQTAAPVQAELPVRAEPATQAAVRAAHPSDVRDW